MSIFKKEINKGLKFGKKVVDKTQRFGKKISKDVKNKTRQFNKDAKRVANNLEKGSKEVDDFNLYVPLLNDAKSVVSSGMRNIADGSRLAGKTGLVASDITRGDLLKAKNRGMSAISDGKELSKDIMNTVAKGKDVYSRGVRLASGDASALFV